ncbi:universal stress protein [Salinivibrio sp. MA351]|uniref:universal stress protein n=1 Tax=Salinivibrio sp. MA351 TaxID=1909453 RepID=UPI000988E388|nr:universal stress protein [Salinivibrio sp. MA351]OOF00525.1 universal stress protein [Salinivibrio sp. MA351]
MYKHILVPVDLNDESFADNAVDHAAWLASQSGAKLHLLTVLPGIHNSMVASYFPEEAANKMKRDMKRNLQGFADKYVPKNVACQVSVEEGKPYKGIIKTAERLECDLIVMPSHKRSRVNKMMLGSVAAKVLEGATMHVMVLKP